MQFSEKKRNEFIRAYDRYADAIFRHCFFRLYNQEELAQDVTQEVFIRIWKYMNQGKEIGDMKAFLYQTADNLIIDQLRKRRSVSLEKMEEKGVVFRQQEKEGIEEIDTRAVVELLRKASLDDASLQAVLMKYLDEMSIKEIAHVLNESESTIGVRIHRGVQKIRKLLSENHGKPKRSNSASV